MRYETCPPHRLVRRDRKQPQADEALDQHNSARSAVGGDEHRNGRNRLQRHSEQRVPPFREVAQSCSSDMHATRSVQPLHALPQRVLAPCDGRKRPVYPRQDDEREEVDGPVDEDAGDGDGARDVPEDALGARREEEVPAGEVDGCEGELEGDEEQVEAAREREEVVFCDLDGGSRFGAPEVDVHAPEDVHPV